MFANPMSNLLREKPLQIMMISSTEEASAVEDLLCLRANTGRPRRIRYTKATMKGNQMAAHDIKTEWKVKP